MNNKKGFVDVVVGLQWGDEGKGKNIDQLLSSRKYSAVARFQGGANAGHTIEVGDKTFIGHIIPSGIFQKNIDLYIGSGVVVDVVSLINEIKELKSVGYDVTKRLYISHKSKLVSYLHPFLDQAEEHYRSKGGKKIGTTARGIGPAYADVRARRSLLIGDLLYLDFEKKEKKLTTYHMNLLKMYESRYGYKIPTKKIAEARKTWLKAIKEIKKLQICDVAHKAIEKLNSGKNILAEGAQGAMLDVDFGDYPNVTSSNTLPGYVCLGLGVPHRRVRNIYGVIKAYTTKVGGGDFPARIQNEETEKKFQKAGNEFGATTGRPRMCGWLDLFALRYAIELTGTNRLFINKADICESDEIQVVTSYKYGTKKIKGFPMYLSDVRGVVTEKIPGWGKQNYSVNDKKKVSKELASYLRYIENKLKDLEVRIVSVGTGPKRSHHFYWNDIKVK